MEIRSAFPWTRWTSVRLVLVVLQSKRKGQPYLYDDTAEVRERGPVLQ
jgi:hypothetical protein